MCSSDLLLVHGVAVGLAVGSVAGRHVQRLTFEGPLLLAVSARDEREILERLVVVAGQRRRPSLGASCLAVGLPCFVLFRGVQRAAVLVGQNGLLPTAMALNLPMKLSAISS